MCVKEFLHLPSWRNDFFSDKSDEVLGCYDADKHEIWTDCSLRCPQAYGTVGPSWHRRKHLLMNPLVISFVSIRHHHVASPLYWRWHRCKIPAGLRPRFMTSRGRGRGCSACMRCSSKSFREEHQRGRVIKEKKAVGALLVSRAVDFVTRCPGGLVTPKNLSTLV